MELDSTSGWLRGVRHLPSPNWDLRPEGVPVDLVVVHGISLPPGAFGGPWIDALFTNNLDPTRHPAFAAVAELRVSAHCLVRRDGTVTQYVPLHGRAWHAGVSSFEGRSHCNDFSVGIELEGTDDSPYTAPQYDRLAALIAVIAAAYPGVTADRVVGHCDIAPGRKTDPGPEFDWTELRRSLHQRLNRRA